MSFRTTSIARAGPEILRVSFRTTSIARAGPETTLSMSFRTTSIAHAERETLPKTHAEPETTHGEFFARCQ